MILQKIYVYETFRKTTAGQCKPQNSIGMAAMTRGHTDINGLVGDMTVEPFHSVYFYE